MSHITFAVILNLSTNGLWHINLLYWSILDVTGWVSIGSLDGFLYSFSPNGVLKKFSSRNTENSVVQVGPFLDCSGFAIYYSQIQMEGKVSHTVDDYTVVSAIRPKAAFFTMLVPATGSIYWSEIYPGMSYHVFSFLSSLLLPFEKDCI